MDRPRLSAIFALITLPLAACSLEPWGTGKTRITIDLPEFNGDPNLSAFPVETPRVQADPPGSFNCLLVNVMGDGIPSASSGESVGARLPGLLSGTSHCSYPGVLSRALPYDSAQKTVELIVPQGASRVIQVLGVTETSAGICSGTKGPPDGFGDSGFALYSLASTITDLFGERAVTLNNTYSSLETSGKAARKANCSVSGDGAAAQTYSETIASTSGLLAYWRLNESTGTVLTDAASNYSGTYSGGPSLGAVGATTQSGNTAVTFDGSNDYATVSSFATLGSSFTIEFWAKLTSNSGSFYDLLYFTDGTNDLVIRKNTTSEYIKVRQGGTDYVYTAAGEGIDGAWHHWAVTYGSGTLKLYLDGTLKSSASATLNAVTSGTAKIGTSGSYYFTGTLDEVAVYSSTLSATAIQSHHVKGTGG